MPESRKPPAEVARAMSDPVQVLRETLARLRERHGRLLTPEARELLDLAVTNAKQLDELVKELRWKEREAQGKREAMDRRARELV